MPNNNSKLDNRNKLTLQQSLSLKQMIRAIGKKIIILPLVVLDVIGSIYSSLLKLYNANLGNIWFDKQEQKISQQITQIAHVVNGRRYNFKFYTPNWICRYRANTFSAKEPETLAWIDANGGDGAFFDIGANVGLYSIYYGKTKTGSVYAFEPSVFNLALLSKNINANDLYNKVKIIANPLTEINQFADFNLSTTELGGALSAFGVNYGQDGKPLNKVCSYQTLGFTLDFLFASGLLTEVPSMIKIDVDGIEHLILRGAVNTLSNPVCKTVLVEVSTEFSLQADEVSGILTTCGFSLENRTQFKVSETNIINSNVNQIWTKN